MKLKLNAMTVFLIAIFAVIFASSASFVATMEKNVLYNRISRGDYSENAVHFSIDNAGWDYAKLIELARASDLTDFTLIYDNSQTNVRQIYIKGRSDPPPMIAGRYFSDEDFKNSRPVAVIGQNLRGQVINDNGASWIDLENLRCEVIGVMGCDIGTSLDDRIIVNANSYSQKGPTSMYILDAYSGSSKDSSLNLFNAINRIAGENGQPMKWLDYDPVGTDRLLASLVQDTVLFVLLLACYVLCSVSISLEWIGKQRRQIAVMRLIGWDNRTLRFCIYRDYFKCALAGACLGYAYAITFGAGINNKSWLVAVLAATVILGWLMTVVPIRKMLKISVYEVLG